MKGFAPLFLGILGTFAFSWFGLIMIPNAQIGHLDPQMDEDGNDAYPAPKSGMAERGRKVYVANGCVYCHSQQIRPEYAASDIDRKWGTRRSAPRDYIFDRPVLLGKMRMGPDLANIGKRAPADDENAPAPGSVNTTAGAPAAAAPPAASAPPPAPNAPSASPASATAAASAPPAPGGSPAAPIAVAAGAPSPAPATGAPTANAATPAAASVAENQGDKVPPQYSASWHHRHLYDPRSLVPDSTMPSYRFLYEKRRIGGERAADAVNLTGPAAAANDFEIVPTYDAKCLVAYLMSLDQSHALNEVKSSSPVSPPAPGKAAK